MNERATNIESIFAARQAEQAADVEFARSIGAFEIEVLDEQGRTREIAYIGIDDKGNRFKLDRVCSLWRIPKRKKYGDDCFVSITGTFVARVNIFPTTDPTIMLREPRGQCPVQADGFIGDCEFYFRSRGTHWSVCIGGAELVTSPTWYYEEYYGEWPTAGNISKKETANFIVEATSKFQSGCPTMNKTGIKI